MNDWKWKIGLTNNSTASSSPRQNASMSFRERLAHRETTRDSVAQTQLYEDQIIFERHLTTISGSNFHERFDFRTMYFIT